MKFDFSMILKIILIIFLFGDKNMAAKNTSDAKLHPEMEKYLANINTLNPPFLIDQIRFHFTQGLKGIENSNKYLNLDIKNFPITSSFGDLPARSYRLNDLQGELPVFVFFHGGGFVLGDLDILDDFCCEIARSSRCLLISVHYPLAPENRFPVAPQSCFEAVTWIWDHFEKGKQNPNKLFVGGSSAGATLAAVVALMSRDKNGPPLAGQILLCPMTNTNMSTESYIKYGSGYNITKEQCEWFYSQYAQSDDDYKNPYFAPMKAKSFKNLPPALIISAECDPLATESREYADSFKANNVPTTFKEYAGMLHGFYSIPTGNKLKAKEEVLEQMSVFIKSNS